MSGPRFHFIPEMRRFKEGDDMIAVQCSCGFTEDRQSMHKGHIGVQFLTYDDGVRNLFRRP
jgi:hypothetical protein